MKTCIDPNSDASVEDWGPDFSLAMFFISVHIWQGDMLSCTIVIDGLMGVGQFWAIALMSVLINCFWSLSFSAVFLGF